MTGSDVAFNPSTGTQRDLAKRLQVTGEALPTGWVAGRVPRPALPIDDCVSELIRKRRIRAAADLKALHPLGTCPYAIARLAVLRAASHARIQQSIEDEVRPAVAAAVNYLKDEARQLARRIHGAERKAQVLVDGLDLLELSLPRGKALLGALSRSRELLENSTRNFVALHKQVSRYRGDVWRLSFVRALFAEWWLLTGKDPKSSPGPCQDFICAAWCSLSPAAAPTDADWGSAIKVALARCQPGEWRSQWHASSKNLI
jgi:hypothetical protein